MPMNPRKLVPTQEPGVLDFAPGAAAAYSLRNLSHLYSGPVVTVRRSTDNAEADFTASEVSDGTLAGWAGADGFVKTWWDQSGNARHATASGTAQPQIVDSGVLVTEGGKAALLFDGVDDYFIRDMTATNQLYSAFYVYHHKAALSVAERILSLNCNITHTTGADVGAQSAGNDLKVLQQAVSWGIGSFSAEVGDTHLLYFTTGAGSTPLALYGDGVQSQASYNLASPATTGSFLAIMARGDGTYNAYGAVSELIIYPTDMTALRQRIEGNLAWYY